MKMFVWIVISTFVGAGLVSASGCGTSSSASPGDAKPRTTPTRHIQVEVVAVRRQALSTDVEFTGNLLPRRIARVVAEVDGIVREIPRVGTRFDVEVNGRSYSEQIGITIGQRVRKDDVLVQLDTRDFDIAVAIAQAKVDKAKADLEKLRSWKRPEEVQQLKAARDEAKARYEQAARKYARIDQLFRRNAVTESEVEQAATDVATTKAALDSADANLALANAGPTREEGLVQQALITQAEAELQQKQRDLEKATIRAPFDGVVTAIQVEEGDRVSASNGTIVDLMDLRFLIAEVGVPESYVRRIKVHDRAEVSVAGRSSPLPGIVIAINEMVDPQTRTFQLRIAIDNESRELKAGQFAKVRLKVGGGQSGSLAVPSESIVFAEGQPRVFVCRNGQVESRSIQVGVSNATTTEVITGLQEGDEVVVDKPAMLADGMQVDVARRTAPVVKL